MEPFPIRPTVTGTVNVGTDRYFVRDVKSPPAVCLPVDRQDRLQCMQKMENAPHSFQIMLSLPSFPFLSLLPSPLCSLVWVLCWLLPQSVTTKRCWARKCTHTHKKNIFDFTSRAINSVDCRACKFQSEKKNTAPKRGNDKKGEQQHFCRFVFEFLQMAFL